MSRTEFRNHAEYKKCMDKIKGYPAGFEFTMYYENIPREKGNALKIILRDACNEGILESIAIGYGWDKKGIFGLMDETYRRTEASHD